MYPYRELFDKLFNERLLDHLDVKETLIEFFVVFSRFEYALKRAGYVSGNDKRASANWDKFASDMEDAFRPDQTAELQHAVAYLQDSPPKKQVVQDDELGWRDSIPSGNEPRLKWLLKLVRTVRNNLFHGEKLHALVGGHSLRDANLTRDIDLIRYSLVVLYACPNLHPKVRRNLLAEMEWKLQDE